MQQLIPHWAEARGSFKRLVETLEERSVSFNAEIAGEVSERLEFMGFAIRALASLADEHLKEHAIKLEKLRRGIYDSSMFASLQSAPWFFQTKYHTEALYMHAFRVRDAVRHGSKPIPGMSTFEAPGVRDVRNHLLIHPEGNGSKIFSQSFSWGVETGSIIKPRRGPAEAGRHVDRGLVPNMTEYLDRFVMVANAAVPAQPVDDREGSR